MSDRRLRGRGASFSATCGVVRYHTDPSGTLTPYAAHAIGNGHEGALALLEEKYSKSMNLRDAELLVARVLRDTMEEKVSATNIQIAAVSQHEQHRRDGAGLHSGRLGCFHARPTCRRQSTWLDGFPFLFFHLFGLVWYVVVVFR